MPSVKGNLVVGIFGIILFFVGKAAQLWIFPFRKEWIVDKLAESGLSSFCILKWR